MFHFQILTIRKTEQNRGPTIRKPILYFVDQSPPPDPNSMLHIYEVRMGLLMKPQAEKFLRPHIPFCLNYAGINTPHEKARFSFFDLNYHGPNQEGQHASYIVPGFELSQPDNFDIVATFAVTT